MSTKESIPHLRKMTHCTKDKHTLRGDKTSRLQLTCTYNDASPESGEGCALSVTAAFSSPVENLVEQRLLPLENGTVIVLKNSTRLIMVTLVIVK